LTGLGISAGLAAASGTGIFSQPAATAAGGTPSAVSNAVQTGPDALSQSANPNSSYIYPAPAENYWKGTLDSSFEFDPESFTGGSSYALASEMGDNFPAFTSDADVTEAINNGEMAFGDFQTNAMASIFGSGGGGGQLNEDATTIQSKDTEGDIPTSWYFITAPQDVSWSKEGRVSTADTYGTNSPYVLYGSTGLRKLTLSNAMLEGFSDRKTVEANIVALETCMNMVIQNGYTAPYCWKAYSGGKSYGTFIITGVKVKEVMRDLRGYATRAFVDIELQQVPDYQVNDGRDLASTSILGGLSSAVQKMVNSQNKDSAKKATDAAAGKSGTGASSTGTAGKQDDSVREATGLREQIQ